MESWIRGNSFPKLSGVFSIFMAPALAFHLLPWWVSILVVGAGFACFFQFIMLLKKHVQYVAVIGLLIGWIWLAARLVEI